MEQAVEAAREADVIVAVLGGTSSRFGGGEFHNNGALKAQDMATMDCGENVDTSRLELPGDQLTLLAQLKDTGKAGGDRAHSRAALCHGGGDGPLRCPVLLLLPRSHRGRGAGPAPLRRGGSGGPSAGIPAGSCGTAAGVLQDYKDSYRGMDYYDARERPRLLLWRWSDLYHLFLLPSGGSSGRRGGES